MSLKKIEINLDEIFKEKEIEEKKLELGYTKNNKYSEIYNNYPVNLSKKLIEKKEKKDIYNQKIQDLDELQKLYILKKEKLRNTYEPQKKEKINNYENLINLEKKSMISRIDEVNNWYKNQKLISKIKLFFQGYNLAKEKETIFEEYTWRTELLENSRNFDLKNIQYIYNAELKKINFLEKSKEKDIELLKDELKTLNNEIEKLEINIKFILSNDILIIDDLFDKVKNICEYKKYPEKKYINNLEKKSKEIIDKYGTNFELIDNIKLKKLKKYIEDRTMFLPDTKDKFIERELEKTNILLSNIDNKSLDKQQRIAVVTDEENILVVAGAGSGKTLTISAKVKYLVENLNIPPEDILLITFTKKAAEEMEIRIKDKLGIDIKVKTFHGLGYELLANFEDKKADVFSGPENFTKYFKKKFEEKDEEFSKMLFKYLSLYIYPYQDPTQFSSLGDFYKKNKLMGLQGIKEKIESILMKEENKILTLVLEKINSFLELCKETKNSNILYKYLINLKKIINESSVKIEKNINLQDTKLLLKEILNACSFLEAELNVDRISTEEFQEKLNEILTNLENSKLTLKKEQMKSIEEVIIANFFYVNGIKYEYEKEYQFTTATKNFRQYKPDFYLTDYGIYIEHFGINENGRCPQYSKIEEIRYLEAIEWKRELHQKYETIMEETYSFEHGQGKLIEKLIQILKKHNIPMKPLTTEDIIKNILILNNDESIGDFYKLLNIFLNLFKASNLKKADLDKFKLLASNQLSEYVKEKHLLFLEIFEKYYMEYEKMLKEKGLIDFSDMINRATNYLENSKLPKEYKFKYIIIDEFQDISVARYNLVNAIKKSASSKIMAVGDDWQSIYKFAGSEISIFTNFKKYFGETEFLKIEKTYRNSQQLIDIAGKFIMQNSNQFKKNLISDKKIKNAIQLLEYSSTSSNVDEDSNSLVRKVIEVLDNFGNESKKISLLGRNNYDINIFKESKLFVLIEKDEKIIVQSKLYPNLKIDFMSIHKSKGLEADEIIIINNKNSITGFPNQITDDSVLEYVSVGNEDYSFAEERRLFYVALTRTKNRVYLLYPEEYSIFIQELMDYASSDIINIQRETIEKKISCPICKTGHLVSKIGKNSKTFYSCSNYPQCSFKIEELKYVKSKVRCPKCGGVMQLKNGPYGEFYGCTNYPYCKFTYKIEDFEMLNKER